MSALNRAVTLLLAAVVLAMPAATRAEPAPPNVLMIWVDDLRPELGHAGVSGMVTPSLDRLAARSVAFERAYCNIPVCGASRASVMTGLRGTPERFTGYLSRADADAPSVPAMNDWLRDAGYYTVSIGKVLHVKEDHAAGWDESHNRPNSGRYFSEENLQLIKKRSKAGKRGAPWERVGANGDDANDNEIADVRVANAACEAIKRLAGGEKPFFIAAGFYKPHLPFVAPARFWDPYPVDQVRLPANFATRPDAPDVAFAKWGELRAYHSIPAKGPVSEATARELIASYRACVSFTDSQVGRLLDTLDASGAAGNTVVVLLGDHGWNLGEHGMWCKHCVFETSMRTPLLVSAPMMEGFRTGESTATLTEFVDVLPTVCELIGLPAPPQAVGVSFVPVLSDPAYRHRDAAIGRYGLGDTIRTDRYRYSVFRRKDQELGHMLYDHDADPAEDTNLVDDPAMADVVADLSRRLAEATGR